MFASSSSLTASLHSTLASHVFGRFASSSVLSPVVAMPKQAESKVVNQLALNTVDADEGEEVDLAQRVRDVGEW